MKRPEGKWPGHPEFFRLFMVPGMSHCSGGECPNQFDSVTNIVNWVEKGKAPDKIIAKRLRMERSSAQGHSAHILKWPVSRAQVALMMRKTLNA
jgi:hypothetical protein